MKISLLLSKIFFLIQIGLFAQVTNQDSILVNPKDLIVTKSLLPFGNQGFVKIKSDNLEDPSVLEIEAYNLKNELLHKQILPTKRENEWFAIEGTFVWDTTLVVLASLYHPGPQKNHLLLYQYSLPNLELVNSKILLTSFAPTETRIPFLHKLSPDKSQLVISAWSFRGEKENGKIDLAIYDQEFNKISQRTKTLPFENRRLFQEEVLIDNLGNCYYIGNNYTGNLFTELRPMAMKKFILAFYATENRDPIYQLPKSKINYEQTQFTINPKQELVGLTLSKIGAKFSQEGTVFTKINPTAKTFSVHYQKIEKEQFKAAFIKATPNFIPPKYLFSDYTLKQIFAIGDAYYLMGDRYQETGYGYEGEFDIAKVEMKFELQDILVIKLNVNGVLEWISRIPKKQALGEKLLPFSSFKAFARKDHLLFLFNDTYDNLSEVAQSPLVKATPKNAKLVITQLALEDGTFKRRRLQSLIGEKYLTQTIYSHKINENELFFYANGRVVGAKTSIVKTLKLKPE